MPTDQPGQLLAEEAPPKESPIENELPTYRAISNRAVFSVICGVLASFSFADLKFLFFSALALVLGILANRAIKRSPDTLTGTRLANTGIAMGLIFGLTVITYTGLQTFLLRRAATKFALEFAQVLKGGSRGAMLLYREAPANRKDMTPAQKEKEYTSMKDRDRMMMEQKLAPMLNLQGALQAKDADIHFVDVESQGVDTSQSSGVYYFATVLYEIHGAATGGTTGTRQDTHALAIFKGQGKGRNYEWWVNDIRYPYQPATYKPPDKPVDDGHGHAH